MPRTCVSLPFMWFEMMAIWRRCARIGSLRAAWAGESVRAGAAKTKRERDRWAHSFVAEGSSPGRAEAVRRRTCHPLGWPSSTQRTSYRSPWYVPARIESLCGVYESSWPMSA